MKLFAALGVILTLATASPLEVHPRDEGGSLAKRDTEIVYLANCISAVSCCTPAVHYSQIGVSALQHNIPSAPLKKPVERVLTFMSPTVLRDQCGLPNR